MSAMTPREIVHELDQHIIGQNDAKRAVAIALRNRWRRMQLDAELRAEVTPKNILMIGPTGVGKTEIARRLAKLAHAPFIKVEATKFTEVGYVGKEVESIIRDLIEVSIKLTREVAMKKNKHKAEETAEERILDALLPKPRDSFGQDIQSEDPESSTRQVLRKRLRQGELDDKEIEIDVAQKEIGVEIMAPPGMEEMTSQLQGMFQNLSGDKTKEQAIEAAEQNGIVFIDEIDKICKREGANSADVSREGVQRDLLPLVEGSTVSTKYGMVKTDHMLFVASGAFQMSKPSDLIPELQGRLPIRVELSALTPEDFERILTEPNASLTEQYIALLATEGLSIEFTKDGIKEIAQVAFKVNERSENIGARRLHTILERLMEEISFTASESSGNTVVIDQTFVKDNLDEIVEDEDLSKFIL